MSTDDAVFGARLFDDEFSPRDEVMNNFWRVPKAIAGIDNKLLSNGAKLLYGVLVGLCYKRNTAWVTKEKIQKYLGGPSKKTLYLWQRELIEARLIRVHQKGRGLPNNYYLLRSPILGNMKPGQSQVMQVYKDPKTGSTYLKSHKECMAEFIGEADAWLEHQKIEQTPFPKPNWRYNRQDYKEIKQAYEGSLKYMSSFTQEPEEVAFESDRAKENKLALEAQNYFMEEMLLIKKGSTQ